MLCLVSTPRRHLKWAHGMHTKFAYAVPCLRPFTVEESSLLNYVVKHEHPARMDELEGLMVIGRCGCEKCPTILLGRGPKVLPTSPCYDLTHIVYLGMNQQGVMVAVALLERGGQFSELEAWSFAGDAVLSWPRPEDLESTAMFLH